MPGQRVYAGLIQSGHIALPGDPQHRIGALRQKRGGWNQCHGQPRDQHLSAAGGEAGGRFLFRRNFGQIQNTISRISTKRVQLVQAAKHPTQAKCTCSTRKGPGTHQDTGVPGAGLHSLHTRPGHSLHYRRFCPPGLFPKTGEYEVDESLSWSDNLWLKDTEDEMLTTQ